MRVRQRQNLQRRSKAELWMAEHLSKTGVKWTRQAIWGRRIFDFWSHDLGIAIEVDGPEHKKKVDDYKDAYNLHRSGVIVIRVKNFNEDDAQMALEKILNCKENWKARRKRLGLRGSGKTLAKRKWQEAGCLDDLRADLFDHH
jgi:very-short-patch-repair endonuclease